MIKRVLPSQAGTSSSEVRSPRRKGLRNLLPVSPSAKRIMDAAKSIAIPGPINPISKDTLFNISN